jgi:hypothetical protein
MEWLVFVIMAGGIQKAYLEVRQPEAARGRFSVNARLIRSGTV